MEFLTCYPVTFTWLSNTAVKMYFPIEIFYTKALQKVIKNTCPGTSWSCPSPTLTPPFPLPPMEGEDDPVEALLQLAQNGRESSHVITTVTGNVEPSESMESDEGIVSDQSNEFEDNKKRLKVAFVTFYRTNSKIYCNIIYIERLFVSTYLFSASLSPMG